MESAPEFLSHIADSETITLFAPSNTAMKSPQLASVFTNKTKLREILDLHLVKGKRITTEDVLNKGITEVRIELDQKVPSSNPRCLFYICLCVDTLDSLELRQIDLSSTVSNEEKNHEKEI